MIFNDFGLTPLFGDRRGFMPAQLKTTWQQNDLSWSPNVEWIIKNPLFYGFWALFLLEAVEAMDVTFNQI